MATLANMIAAVRRRTDTVGSDHVTDEEIRELLLDSSAGLHGKLCTAYEDYAVNEYDAEVTDSSAAGFALPEDFFKLLRLDRRSGDGKWCPLIRVPIRAEASPQAAMGYVMRGTMVHVVPQRKVVGSYRMLYYPAFVAPSSDTTEFAIGPAGQRWELYPILEASIAIAGTEQLDPSAHVALLARLDDRLADEIANRDAGEAEPPPPATVAWYERV